MSRNRAPGFSWLGHGEEQRKWAINYLQKTMLPKLKDRGVWQGNLMDMVQHLASYSSRAELLEIGDRLEKDGRYKHELWQMKIAWNTQKSRNAPSEMEKYSLTLHRNIKRKIKNRARDEGISEADFVTWLATEDQDSNKKVKDKNKKLADKNNELRKKNDRASKYLNYFKTEVTEIVKNLLIENNKLKEADNPGYNPEDELGDSKDNEFESIAQQEAERIIKAAMPKRSFLDNNLGGPIDRGELSLRVD